MQQLVEPVYKYHIFACFQQRPPGHPRGSCMSAGGKPLWDHLQARLQAKPLPGVAVAATGCLGFCRAGPLMVVYPEGLWYVPRSTEDIDKIIDQHFIKGEPVEDLIIVPNP